MIDKLAKLKKVEESQMITIKLDLEKTIYKEISSIIDTSGRLFVANINQVDKSFYEVIINLRNRTA